MPLVSFVSDATLEKAAYFIGGGLATAGGIYAFNKLVKSPATSKKKAKKKTKKVAAANSGNRKARAKKVVRRVKKAKKVAKVSE